MDVKYDFYCSLKIIVSASFSQIKMSICYLILDFTQPVIFLVKSENFIFVTFYTLSETHFYADSNAPTLLSMQ